MKVDHTGLKGVVTDEALTELRSRIGREFVTRTPPNLEEARAAVDGGAPEQVRVRVHQKLVISVGVNADMPTRAFIFGVVRNVFHQFPQRQAAFANAIRARFQASNRQQALNQLIKPVSLQLNPIQLPLNF